MGQCKFQGLEPAAVRPLAATMGRPARGNPCANGARPKPGASRTPAPTGPNLCPFEKPKAFPKPGAWTPFLSRFDGTHQKTVAKGAKPVGFRRLEPPDKLGLANRCGVQCPAPITIP